MPEVARRLQRTLPVADERGAVRVVNALCALISVARRRDADGVAIQPLLHVGVHLWIRELRRMVCSVSGRSDVQPTPRLRHSDDLVDHDDEALHLPLVQCRECHMTGWGAVQRPSRPRLDSDLRVFYTKFFRRDVDVCFLFPTEQQPPGKAIERSVCGMCGYVSNRVQDGSCRKCDSQRLVRVWQPVETVESRSGKMAKLSRDCAWCGASHGLIIFGAQASSLLSVLLSQVFGSRHNDDPKALAFSDNVQAAAHRAGFLTARIAGTHRRMTIAQAVAKHEGASLAEFPGLVEASARAAAASDEDFVGAHIARDRQWYRDFVELEKSGHLPAGSEIPRWVARRLRWDALAELTFRSEIGRTLEQTRVAAVVVDQGLLDDAVNEAHGRLKGEIGSLEHLARSDAKTLVLGTVWRMKNRGALFPHPNSDEALCWPWQGPMRAYLKSGGNRFAPGFKRDPSLPDFGPRSARPVFPATDRAKEGLEPVLGPHGPRSWYQRWANAALTASHPMIASEIDAAMRVLFGALVSSGLVHRVQGGHAEAWALDPTHLRVTGATATMVPQPLGGRPLVVAASEKDVWQGVPSLYGTGGRYALDQGKGATWFGELYLKGRKQRLVAAEHTALVERDERDRLQTVFSQEAGERRPWQPNVLSATPTLELGIDIGDLSTVVLCSVPPSTASYVQRAGRAGRRDGNAISLALATANPHDLYFFADPRDMLAAGVDPPGIFLNAVAVLERQLTAFCFDNWSASGVPEDAVPKKIGPVLGNLEKNVQTAFPHTFFNFVRNRADDLLERFAGAFAGSLEPPTRQALKEFLMGDVGIQEPSLVLRMRQRMREVVEERRSVANDLRRLRRRIAKLKSRPTDEATTEEIRMLERNRKGLRKVLNEMVGKDTFNFLTDEGLIPNYAFPQAGVKLRSVIYWHRPAVPATGIKEYETDIQEYERPAAAALGEFAPENVFYARRRHVQIDRVDTRLSAIEEWRMCPTCTYAENVAASGDGRATCPRCDTPAWKDSGQLHNLLRLKLVHAETRDRMSRIGDQRDDREHVFYERRLVADFDPDMVEHAYVIREPAAAFGFEYIRRATFREVNFGRAGQPTQHRTVADARLPKEGFRICRRCGKVQPGAGSKPQHAPTCRAARASRPGDIVDCLYLYREFESEAIRMLLPAGGSPNADQRVNSFVAALELGLRRKFGGEIGHLRSMTCRYPVKRGDHQQRYLLLYDTVPGGTGYLKDRMTAPEKLLDVFQCALDAMESCECKQDPSRDGCYRCVLAYRRSRDMADTSREVARKMLRGILDHQGALESVAGLYQEPPVVQVDSVLEERFIEALRHDQVNGQRRFQVRYDLVDGKPGFILRVRDSNDAGAVYHIAPQVDLGKAEAVTVASRPDFVIRPAKASAADDPPIAVFLDGFEYHRDRVHDDTAKRTALVRAGYLVWSLTWRDLDEASSEAAPEGAPIFAPSTGGGSIAQVQAKLDAQWESSSIRSKLDRGAFELLCRYLAEPSHERWRQAVFTHLLGWFDPGRMLSPELRDKFEKGVRTLPPGAVDSFQELEGQVALAGQGRWRGTAPGLAQLLLALPTAAISTADPDGLWVAVHLRDDDENRADEAYQSTWNGVLGLFNLLQFLPLAWWSTSRGVEGDLYGALPPPNPQTGSEPPPEWVDAFRFAAPEAHEFMTRLADGDVPVPDVGYEVMDAKGAVLGDAELAWPDARLAVLLPDQAAVRASLAREGWASWMIDEAALEDGIGAAFATSLSAATEDHDR